MVDVTPRKIISEKAVHANNWTQRLRAVCLKDRDMDAWSTAEFLSSKFNFTDVFP